MKVVFDARFFGTRHTGLGVYSEELIKNMVKLFPNDQFIALFNSPEFDECKIISPNFSKILINIPTYSISEQFKLIKILNELKPDIVHFLNFNKPIFYFKPNIYTFFDLTLLRHEGKRYAKKSFLERFVRKVFYIFQLFAGSWSSSKILSITNFAKDDFVKTFKFIPKNRIVPIWLGYDKNKFNENISEESVRKVCKKFGLTKKFALYVGNDRPHKNLDRLVIAWSKLPKDIQEKYDLVFVGKMSEDSSAKKIAKEYGVNAKFLGYADDEDWPVLFKASHIYVFPSLAEGFGLTIIEAMATGSVVVSSFATTLSEVGGDSAIFFDPLDIDDMAKKIQEGLENEVLRKEMKEKARKHILLFDWEECARKTYLEYLRILIKKN